MAAGLGTTWYTWLEQGRDVSPSREALAALARALRLDSAETSHLFTLAGRDLPQRAPTAAENVDATLLRMLDSMTMQPAHVVGRRWDVLAWNRAAAAVFADYAALHGDERNIMHLLFAEPAHRELLVEWEGVARVALGLFRAASAKYVGDRDFERLIALLQDKSPEFREWWPERDVNRQLAGTKRIQHPVAGPMAFEHMSLSIDNGSDMRLIVYTPLVEHGTIGKLSQLLGGP